MDKLHWKYLRRIHKDSNSCVTIEAHWTGRWCWNVYAYLYPDHNLFAGVDVWDDLHFRGGISLEQKITTEPAKGIRYGFQRVNECVKLGSDYNHLWNEENPVGGDPADGEPPQVVADAEKLSMQLRD